MKINRRKKTDDLRLEQHFLTSTTSELPCAAPSSAKNWHSQVTLIARITAQFYTFLPMLV
ncbi:hypothetical protein C1H46_021120 [Malus baccata]|uniref:Uncharacterized protein n=1 Tax=Malus baccata TaxID=106549 RepID=A0A540M392_MALBA|nr:hypothetical protein C1H46_021120 [Malus baccata]